MKLPDGPDTSGGIFDVPTQQERISELESRMGQNDFWDDQEAANRIVTEVSHTKGRIQPIIKYHERLDDVRTMMELVEDAEGRKRRSTCAKSVRRWKSSSRTSIRWKSKVS
mgnify:CR=1 FL=1